MTSPSPPLSPGAVIYQRQGTTIALIVVSVALLVSLLANVVQLLLSGTVYYTTVGAGIRAAQPGEIPAKALREVSVGILRLLTNGTAAGLEENWTDAESYMSDKARKTFAHIKAEQMDMIKKGKIVLVTEAVKVTTIVKESQAVYRVDLSALQTVKYGLYAVGPTPVTASVWLIPGHLDSVFGLWVYDLKLPPISTPSGPVIAR